MWGQPPRRSSQAKRGAPATTPSTSAHTAATSLTKQDYASRRDQPGCSCPKGKSLPLTQAYPAAKSESMGAYLLSPEADAGTARIFAHSRNSRISSARVMESGTVCVSASSRNWVVSGFFWENAA